jgi:hypothetical protein
MEKWGPLRKRLTEYWLPRFPEDVRDKARLFGMRRLPPVE